MATYSKAPAAGTALVTIFGAIAATTGLSGRSAMAACAPLTAGTGVTVTCDTSAPNPETSGIATTGTSVTLSVLPGARFEPASEFQFLPATSVIENDGTIITDFSMGSEATINNRRVIEGSYDLSADDDVVTNSGSIDTGSIGTIGDGEFNLLGGDDTFTLVDDGVVDGIIDGGPGTDTLKLQGTGSADTTASFTFFEELVVDDGANWTFGALSPTFDTLTVGAGSVVFPAGITGDTVAVASGGTARFSGTSTFTGDLSNSGTVIAVGSLTVEDVVNAGLLDVDGTMAATGTITNTGTTDIDGTLTATGFTNSGTLAIDGALTTGTLSLESGGSLSGTGSLTGSVTSSGTIAPGASIGTLAIDGSIDFATGSVLEVEFGGDPVVGDLVTATGTATIADGSTVRFIELTESGTGTFDFLVAAGGVTGSFTSVESTLLDLTREVELVATSPTTLSAVVSLADGSTLIENAPYNPVNGSPSSLLQDMSSNDYWAGVDNVGGTEINFDYTSLTQDGVDIDVFKLPIRHTFDLPDTDMQLILQAPFAYATIDDDVVYSQQIGTALRIPILDYWELTPAVRVGGVYSDDFLSEAIGYGGAVTSRFEFMIGEYTVQVGNHVGYYTAQDVDLFLDESINYDTENILLRNGVIVNGPIPMFGSVLDVQAFAVDTRNFGDDLFVESYVDIGASANLSDLIGYPVRFGAKGTFGDDTTGFSINTGYRF